MISKCFLVIIELSASEKVEWRTEHVPEEDGDEVGCEAHGEETAGDLVWGDATLPWFLPQDLRQLVVAVEELQELFKAALTARRAQRRNELSLQAAVAEQQSRRRSLFTCSLLWWSCTPSGPRRLPAPGWRRYYSWCQRWFPSRTRPTCPGEQTEQVFLRSFCRS